LVVAGKVGCVRYRGAVFGTEGGLGAASSAAARRACLHTPRRFQHPRHSDGAKQTAGAKRGEKGRSGATRAPTAPCSCSEGRGPHPQQPARPTFGIGSPVSRTISAIRSVSLEKGLSSTTPATRASLELYSRAVTAPMERPHRPMSETSRRARSHSTTTVAAGVKWPGGGGAMGGRGGTVRTHARAWRGTRQHWTDSGWRRLRAALQGTAAAAPQGLKRAGQKLGGGRWDQQATETSKPRSSPPRSSASL
jgi:hypothetical protein